MARKLLATRMQIRNSSFKKRRRNFSPQRIRGSAPAPRGITITKENNHQFGIDTSIVLHSMNINDLSADNQEYIQLESG